MNESFLTQSQKQFFRSVSLMREARQFAETQQKEHNFGLFQGFVLLDDRQLSIKKKYTDSRVSLLNTCQFTANRLEALETDEPAGKPAERTVAKRKQRKKKVSSAAKQSRKESHPEKVESLAVVGQALEPNVRKRSFKAQTTEAPSQKKLENRFFQIRTRSFDFKSMLEPRTGSRCSMRTGSAQKYWLEGEEKGSAGELGRLFGSSLQ